MCSEEENIVLAAGFDHFGRPDRSLGFADMRLTQHEHAQARLTDAAADGVRKFFMNNCLMERKVSSLGTACLFKLV